MVERVVTVRDEADKIGRDDRTLRSWHADHSAWLHDFLRRSLRLQAAEADDIMQDTWLRVIRIPLADVHHPRSLLSRIALNIFRDHRRHDTVRRRHQRLVLASDRGQANPTGLTEQEANGELERLILDLPEDIRDVFLFSRFRSMTNREIAAYFGISVKTVEWRIGRAIQLCASRLQG